MEACESMEDRSQSRSLDVQPSSEGLGSTSESFPSDGGPSSALAAATAAAVAATAPASTAKAATLSTNDKASYSEPSSDSLEEPCAEPTFTHKIGCQSLGFEPVYIPSAAQDPCNTNDLHSSPAPVPDSSSDPDCDSGRGTGTGRGPGRVPDPEFRTSVLPCFRNMGAALVPNYTPCCRHILWEPQKQPKQPPWKYLQVSEPGVRGQWRPEDEGKCKVLNETSPRGQCLLYNWEEERATNHLDQVPSMQDGSESFFFRHGHRGLLTLQLQSPMPCSTTQKDSYQPPRQPYQPVRGKREAMLEMLLHHQICQEVQAEQETTRQHSEVESVTHHDYRKELVQAGPPAPTKPHDYRQEQPESFWVQRAPQLPGVSNITTLDTPFRKNCSFSTPVPLSLGQPLPYESETYFHQMGQISSLVCQGGGQGCEGRTTPD